MAAPDLVAPVLLLAMPQVADPFFHKSVVLLLAHEDEGSFGFIVNRSTELKVKDILRDLEIAWGGAPEVLARFGGPVQPQVGTLLFAPESGSPELPGSAEVLPGDSLASCSIAMSRSNRSVRCPSSRTILWIQKNEEMRAPRVTGRT